MSRPQRRKCDCGNISPEPVTVATYICDRCARLETIGYVARHGSRAKPENQETDTREEHPFALRLTTIGAACMRYLRTEGLA